MKQDYSNMTKEQLVEAKQQFINSNKKFFGIVGGGFGALLLSEAIIYTGLETLGLEYAAESFITSVGIFDAILAGVASPATAYQLYQTIKGISAINQAIKTIDYKEKSVGELDGILKVKIEQNRSYEKLSSGSFITALALVGLIYGVEAGLQSVSNANNTLRILAPTFISGVLSMVTIPAGISCYLNNIDIKLINEVLTNKDKAIGSIESQDASLIELPNVSITPSPEHTITDYQIIKPTKVENIILEVLPAVTIEEKQEPKTQEKGWMPSIVSSIFNRTHHTTGMTV